MSQEKADIFLGRIMRRVDAGEFDDRLNIPFASRKLFKAIINQRMAKKVETNSTPVLSDLDLDDILKEVRETAAETAGLFEWAGILTKTDEGLKISDEWDKILNPPQN